MSNEPNLGDQVHQVLAELNAALGDLSVEEQARLDDHAPLMATPAVSADGPRLTETTEESR